MSANPFPPAEGSPERTAAPSGKSNRCDPCNVAENGDLPAGKTLSPPLGEATNAPETTRPWVENKETDKFNRTLPDIAPDQDATISASIAENAADSPLLPGDILDDYKILAILGRGGMGIVYRALQMGAGRVVALKVVRASRLGDDESLRRFESEARAAARVEHENLVTVFDVGQSRGLHFYSMHLVQGESLAELVARQPLAGRRAARYVEQAARAVHAAHELGVLHRDIKPSNILIDGKHDRALIADFGLAKLQESNHELTQSGQVFGTPSYMAPEQALDTATVTAAVDVYSLGATLFHLVTGRTPFRAKSLPELLRQVSESEPPRLRKIVPGIDRDLETICLKCLEKRPERRYPTAQALARDLDRYLAGEPITARRVSRAERAYRWVRRKPIAAGLLAALLLVAVLTGLAGTLAMHNLTARREAEAARAWNSLDERLRVKLEQGSLDPGYLNEVDDLLKQMRGIDPAKTVEAEARFHAAHVAHLRRGVQKQRLLDEDFLALTTALEAYAHYNREPAEELLAGLRSRRREWRDVVVLTEPFTELDKVFPTETVKIVSADGNPATIKPAAKADRVQETHLASRPNSEVELRFSEGWESGKRLGAFIGWKPPQGNDASRAYEFTLVSTPSTPFNFDFRETFAHGRAQGNEPLLRIMRDGELVHQVSLPWRALPPGPLSFRARRDGSKLAVQINHEPPLVVEEIFPSHDVATGVFAIRWPSGAGLVFMRVSSPNEPPGESAIDRGDRLFAEGKFASAGDEYAAAEQQAERAELRDEIRFKRAACLIELNRFEEAEPALMELSLKREGVWPIRATFLAWRHHLRGRHHNEAQELADFVVARYSAESIGGAIPYPLRTEINNLTSALTHYSASTFSESSARLDKALKVRLALATSPAEQRWARYEMILDLKRLDRRQEAIELCKSLESDPALARRLLIDILEDHAELLNLEGRPAEGIAVLRRELAPSPVLNDAYPYDLLVTRAALYCAQDEWSLAKADLDAFLKHDRPTRVGVFLHAFLLAGIVAEKLGNAAAARRSWQEGLKFVRRQAHEMKNTGIYNLPHFPVIASLSEAMTDEDIDTSMGEFMANGLQWNFVKGLFPKDLLYSVPKNSWRTAEGKERALRMAFLQVSYLEMSVLPLKVAVAEAWRETIAGNSRIDDGLSEDHRQVIWDMVEQQYDDFLHGGFKEVEVLLFFQTWNGQTGVLGWQSLSSRLKSDVRAPIEFLFGCHYRNLGRPDDAKRFFTAAVDAAPKEGALRRVARQELEKLKNLKAE